MSSTRKIFVGSLPLGITEHMLKAEFNRYGTVEEVFVKPNCEPSRQWAFVTFAGEEQARLAKESCDRQLIFPGADKPCDVMLAKNQGMYGQSGHGARTVYPPQNNEYSMQPPAQTRPAPGFQAKKIFVGSLPDGIPEPVVRAEFSKYGVIEDIFVKQGCEPGRQWGFITFASADKAQYAQEMTNGALMFPGATRPCEVTVARNQGMFGQTMTDGFGGASQEVGGCGPRKIFVGSLPDGINDLMLRTEFSKYGQITDVFLKDGCESGRNWAFVSFATPDQAQLAKTSCDRVLMFPGCEQPCEVTMARNQGMFGQETVETGYVNQSGAISPVHGGQQHQPYQQGYCGGAAASAQHAPAVQDGPKKIFVGSLPDHITEGVLRAEFSKFGQIVDVFLKQGSEQPDHRWAFVTFATHDQAQYAKEATDRILVIPGAQKACEVMLAKNQGKFGQGNSQGYGGGGGGYGAGYGGGSGYGGGNCGGSNYGGNGAGYGSNAGTPGCGGAGYGGCAGGGGGVQYESAQPPPPVTPPPAHLNPWRVYKTAAGLPYYHNHTTGVTQWEAPPEILNANNCGGCGGGNRYAPY
eukprot:TRINITY_DN10026_c0_g1_i1.p1 TRINITY_DN10026_c0_g1~~TRINITY_DN10026_c0_g1_i1.p1  ORF type:complete len:601 (+),score=88.30 TRINITY_DN10026_c0_g1_i1:68-1804(+)